MAGNPARVQLDVSIEQAQTIAVALNCFTRLGLCQLEEVAHLVSIGVIPARAPSSAAAPLLADVPACRAVTEAMIAAKAALGFESVASRGIRHPHNDICTRRAWEVERVLVKALVEHLNPNPTGFRGADYDGLSLRYTNDPAPVATVTATDEAPHAAAA